MDDSTPATPLLESLVLPDGLRSLTLAQRKQVCEELRALIIDTVSRTGGHLAPGLGVVELTVALYSVFDPSCDRFVWDVGHQAYAHKILTGRLREFHTLRTFGGISGFPRPAESPVYDHFTVGHSSTSISAALGMAAARDLTGSSERVVAIIGDGSMTAGEAFEGLNQAGDMDRDFTVVLNDNEMSISENVGALSSFLSRRLSDPWMVRVKKEVERMLKSIPRIGEDMLEYAKRSEDSLKGFFTPGMLFEAFGFNYIGPVDGHNLADLQRVFEQVRGLDGPVLVHVLTTKGKGYAPAEKNPTNFHGVGCFEPETGIPVKNACALPSYTKVFGQTLAEIAKEDSQVVAITAAMPEGTGMAALKAACPDRFFDVGICEQHAVTFAAGLATRGYKPMVAIYSTFLQRAYDQVVHDVCLPGLPVVFYLDRAGLVGEDGATHHGVFDIAYLRHVPNITLMAPADEAELQRMIYTASASEGPVAVRYPRGVGVGAELAPHGDVRLVTIGQGRMVREGTGICVVALGSRVHPALAAAEQLAETGEADVAVFDARFAKPLPEEQLCELAKRFDRIITVEEGCVQGGFGSAVLELLAERGLLGNVSVTRLGIPDHFIEHGPQKKLRELAGIDAAGIKRTILEV